MKIAFFITTGSEEAEVIAPLDILRRAKIDVQLVSLLPQKNVVTAHGISINADVTFEQVDFQTFDAIILPGGGLGVELMLAHQELLELVQNFYQKGKLLAAICAAPAVFEKAGILKDTPFTCYPTWSNMSKKRGFSQQGVVITEQIITAKSVNFAIEFGLTLVERIVGKDSRKQIEENIYYTTK